MPKKNGSLRTQFVYVNNVIITKNSEWKENHKNYISGLNKNSPNHKIYLCKNLAQCGGFTKLMNYHKLAFESHYLDTQGWFSKRTGISLDNGACSTNTQAMSNQTRIQTIPHALTSSSDVHVLLLYQHIGAN